MDCLTDWARPSAIVTNISLIKITLQQSYLVLNQFFSKGANLWVDLVIARTNYLISWSNYCNEGAKYRYAKLQLFLVFRLESLMISPINLDSYHYWLPYWRWCNIYRWVEERFTIRPFRTYGLLVGKAFDKYTYDYLEDTWTSSIVSCVFSGFICALGKNTTEFICSISVA